jgi:hypothetical protein
MWRPYLISTFRRKNQGIIPKFLLWPLGACDALLAKNASLWAERLDSLEINRHP